MANPILKWPGGKRTLTSTLIPLFPETTGSYHEPFIGGGALFFTGSFKNSHLSDINWELINLYNVVKDNLAELIVELGTNKYENTLERFLEIRALDRDETFEVLSPVEKAARTLYLNKTCFNGLYRVNKKGQFNAHFGHYANPTILDVPALIAAHELLSNNAVSIKQQSYVDAVDNVEAGDLVYLDPPYIPLNPVASFTSYSKDRFGLSDQENLAKVMAELDDRGAFVICSNSGAELTEEVYSDFVKVPVKMSRRINVKGDSRQAIKELLILGRNTVNFLTQERPEVMDSFKE